MSSEYETYKAYYVSIAGLAEPIRLLLIDNAISFFDDQITREQWPALKSQTVSLQK